MQSLSEKILFVWESADLVMSWHAPLSSKMEEKTLFLLGPLHPPPPLNQQTVQFPLPLLVCVPPPPLKIRFFSEPL